MNTSHRHSDDDQAAVTQRLAGVSRDAARAAVEPNAARAAVRQRPAFHDALAGALLACCRRRADGGGLAVHPGSPDARRSEAEAQEQRAREEYEKHICETGLRPKEHAMRMAGDPVYREQEKAEAQQALGEALERIAQRERHARDIVDFHKFEERHALEERWREAWDEEAVQDGLKGLLRPAMLHPEESDLNATLRDKQNALRKAKGAEVPDRDKIALAQQRVTDAQGKLDARESEFASHHATSRIRADLLIDAVVNPTVSAQQLSATVDEFLRHAPVNVNLTKKLSELVSAKAVWFSAADGVELTPGPKAVGGSDSPDYVAGEDIVADNLRVEGISRIRGTVVLIPGADHESAVAGVRGAVRNGIKSKVTTYYEKHVKHARKKVVVTVDVSDCPWVLWPSHLAWIATVVDDSAPDSRPTTIGACLHAVYFVVDGMAYRVFPGWQSPPGFAEGTLPAGMGATKLKAAASLVKGKK